MANPITINDFKAWLERDISRFSKIDGHVETLTLGGSVGPAASDRSEELTVKIYTHTNSYHIRAVNKDGGGYLGCTSSCRKPRAGEDWTRGSDLADGKLTESTWHRILGDILSYEMVALTKTKVGPMGPQIGGPTPDNFPLEAMLTAKRVQPDKHAVPSFVGVYVDIDTPKSEMLSLIQHLTDELEKRDNDKG